MLSCQISIHKVFDGAEPVFSELKVGQVSLAPLEKRVFGMSALCGRDHGGSLEVFVLL